MRLCSLESCSDKHYAIGLCWVHYSRQKRLGDVREDQPIQRKQFFGENAKHVKAQRRRDSIAQRQGMIDVIKLSSGCVDCGYNGHPEALDFDHIEDNKSAQIADLVSSSLDRLFEEIAKCEVVCANCHRVRTAIRRNLTTLV